MKKSKHQTRFLHTIVFFLVCSSNILGQAGDFEASISRATIFQEANNYILALKYYEKAFAISPDQNDIHYYNAACCASLLGDHGKTFQLLNKSIELGYIDLDWLKNDQDFNPVRDKEEWQAVVNKLENRKKDYEKQFAQAASVPLTDFIPFVKEGKWGYLHRKTKQVLIKPQFHSVSFAGNCLVILTSPQSYFCIDGQGKFFVQSYSPPAKAIRIATEGDLVDVIMEEPPMSAIPRIIKIDSTKGFTGFKLDKYNNFVSVSSVFDQYHWPNDNDRTPAIKSPIKIAEQWYAIASKKGKFGLVSEHGEPHPKLDFKYSDLYVVKESKSGQWFFFKDDKDKCGFINLNGEVKFYSVVDEAAYYDNKIDERFGYMVASTEKGKILIDLKTISQFSEPFNGEILGLDHTYKSNNCHVVKPELSPDLIIAHYFLIKDTNGRMYYLGENKMTYLVN